MASAERILLYGQEKYFYNTNAVKRKKKIKRLKAQDSRKQEKPHCLISLGLLCSVEPDRARLITASLAGLESVRHVCSEDLVPHDEEGL